MFLRLVNSSDLYKLKRTLPITIDSNSALIRKPTKNPYWKKFNKNKISKVPAIVTDKKIKFLSVKNNCVKRSLVFTLFFAEITKDTIEREIIFTTKTDARPQV